MGCRQVLEAPGSPSACPGHDVEMTGFQRWAAGSAGPAAGKGCCPRTAPRPREPAGPGAKRRAGRAPWAGSGGPEMPAAKVPTCTSLPRVGLRLRGAHAVTPGTVAGPPSSFQKSGHSLLILGSWSLSPNGPGQGQHQTARLRPGHALPAEQRRRRVEGNQKFPQAVVSALVLWGHWAPVQAPHARTQWISASGPGVGAARAPVAPVGVWRASCAPRRTGGGSPEGQDPFPHRLRVAVSPKHLLPQAPLARSGGRGPFLHTR